MSKASLGFINAGFDVIAGIDLAGDALKTYQLQCAESVKQT